MSAIVSANEAAHHFGVSEKTVRRWIAAGRLKADKHGRAYRVDISEVAALIRHNFAHDSGPLADSGQAADTDSASATADSTSAMFGIVELVALVDRLQAENRDLAAAAAVWQERCRVLTDQLALAAPVTPQQPQEPTLDTSTAPKMPDPSQWLSRLWGRSWAVYGAIGLLAVVVPVLAWVLLGLPR